MSILSKISVAATVFFIPVSTRSGLADPAYSADRHTDARGGGDYNLKSSQRRAEAVVRYLKSRGVDSGQLEVQGYRKKLPKTPDALDAANRGVETCVAN
jgi:hypothetical protein